MKYSVFFPFPCPRRLQNILTYSPFLPSITLASASINTFSFLVSYGSSEPRIHIWITDSGMIPHLFTSRSVETTFFLAGGYAQQCSQQDRLIDVGSYVRGFYMDGQRGWSVWQSSQLTKNKTVIKFQQFWLPG